MDPRDTTWEVEPVAYRVTLWSRPGHGQEAVMWAADERELTGAWVVDVVAWAQRHVAALRTAHPGDDHRATIGAIVDDPRDGRGLVVLNGEEPSDEGAPAVTFGWSDPTP